MATILQLLRLPDGTVKALVEGKRRGRIEAFLPDTEFFMVQVEEIAEQTEKNVQIEALMRSTIRAFENYAKQPMRSSALTPIAAGRRRKRFEMPRS